MCETRTKDSVKNYMSHQSNTRTKRERVRYLSEARTGCYAVTGGFIIAGEVNRTVRGGGDVTGTRPGEEYVLTASL
jgi:hypothetical protein